MAVISLDAVASSLQGYDPDAPRLRLQRSFLEAARKFFQETTAWREEVPVTDGASASTYVLTPPGGAEAFQATHVWHGSDELRQSTRAQLLKRYACGSKPAAYRVGAANTLHIGPEPNASVASDLTVIAAIRPTREALTVEEEAFDTYYEPLVEGAVWRLLLTKGTQAAMSRAEYHRKLFQDAVDYYRSLAADDGQIGVIRKARYGGY